MQDLHAWDDVYTQALQVQADSDCMTVGVARRLTHLELSPLSLNSLSCFLSGGHIILEAGAQQLNLVLSSCQSCLTLPDLLLLDLQVSTSNTSRLPAMICMHMLGFCNM